MFKSRLFGVAAGALVLVTSPMSVFLGTVSAQEAPELQSVHSVAQVTVEGMNRQHLYEFVSDIRNDNLYWIGVNETILLEEGDKDEVGTRYVQRGLFNGMVFDTTIDIVEGKKNHYIVLEGSSPLLSYRATYTFENVGSNSAMFRTESVVTGVGLSPEFIVAYNQVSFNQMLAVLGATGTVEVPVAEYVE